MLKLRVKQHSCRIMSTAAYFIILIGLPIHVVIAKEGKPSMILYTNYTLSVRVSAMKRCIVITNFVNLHLAATI